jgi:hypothetical protein
MLLVTCRDVGGSPSLPVLTVRSDTATPPSPEASRSV